jgi:trigger factor
MVDKQLQYMRENMKKRLSYQQLTLEMVGLDEEKFNSHYREEALSQVRGMLLLDAVAKKEALTVEEPELAAKIAEIATKTGQKPELVKKHYQEDEYARENLAAQLREDKALALMLEKAVVSEVSREKL